MRHQLSAMSPTLPRVTQLARIKLDATELESFPHRERNLKMKVCRSLPGAWVPRICVLGAWLFAATVVPAFSETLQQQADAPAQTQAPNRTQTTTLPPQSQQPQGSAPLRVMVGKSLLINTTERLRRISVTDEGIASVQPVTPTQILVHGKAPGEVSLLIWDELERSRSFDLRVDVDVSTCAEEERRVFPDEQISVRPSRAGRGRSPRQ